MEGAGQVGEVKTCSGETTALKPSREAVSVSWESGKGVGSGSPDSPGLFSKCHESQQGNVVHI